MKGSKEQDRRAHLATRLGVLLFLGGAVEVPAGEPAVATASAAIERAAPNGFVQVPAFVASPSEYMSEAARRQFVSEANRRTVGSYEGLIAQRTAYEEAYIAPRLQRALEVYPVDVRTETLAGVAAVVVTPRQGVSRENRHRVLLNLHAGAFIYGSAATAGVVESAPIASVGRIKVITVDYRRGPEHAFPAALQDITSVYRELLKSYRPVDVGIYGCSSGGQLGGMAMAWFQQEQLPLPAALGVFCSGIDGVMSGDARFSAFALLGRPPPRPSDAIAPAAASEYFGHALTTDPVVFPSFAPAVLAAFPPTLFITASRDFAASAAFHSHARLTRAGVDAQLHVWDGLWHAFINEVDLPESKEAYAVAVDFFRRRLGRRDPEKS